MIVRRSAVSRSVVVADIYLLRWFELLHINKLIDRGHHHLLNMTEFVDTVGWMYVKDGGDNAHVEVLDDGTLHYYSRSTNKRIDLSTEQCTALRRRNAIDVAEDDAYQAIEDMLTGTDLEINGDGVLYEELSYRITIKPKQESSSKSPPSRQ